MKLQRGWCFSLQASCPFGFENKESLKAIPNVATREPLPITPYAPAPSSLPSARNLGPGFFHYLPACHHDYEWITRQYLLACPIYGPAFCSPPQWHRIRAYTLVIEDQIWLKRTCYSCRDVWIPAIESPIQDDNGGGANASKGLDWDRCVLWGRDGPATRNSGNQERGGNCKLPRSNRGQLGSSGATGWSSSQAIPDFVYKRWCSYS